MSLTERVRLAQDSKQLGASISCREPINKTENLTVEELRKSVSDVLSFELIAQIMVENPHRAKNELRAACRLELAKPKWDGLSGFEKRQLVEELIDVVFGMGPIESLISDESVTEIMVNGAHSIFYERDGKLIKSDVKFDNDEQVRVLIDRIISPLGRRIDDSSPMVNARLPQGHRVHSVIPPIAIDGPHITIRAFTQRVMSLEEMSALGSLSKDVVSLLEWLVISRKSLVVCGGTGSGKTTLLNALSRLISPEERIITIEDSAELKFHEHHHVVRLEARPMNSEGEGEITIRELVINALRMRPDRIIVGECRSGEALDMLQAMNTGHDGSLTTIHCNSPEDVIDRLITMVRYAVDLPVDAIEAQIGHAFDYVIQVSRSFDGSRYISSIAEVVYDRKNRSCNIERIFERKDDKDCWIRCPRIVLEILDKVQSPIDKMEVRTWRNRLFGE